MTEELRADSMTGEQWVFDERTADPSSTIEGERWVRTDLNSGDKIATLRVDNGSSILDVPIFETGTSVDVSEALRIRVSGVTGYIPIVPVSDAGFPALRMQHDSSIYGYHNAVEITLRPDSVVTRDADDALSSLSQKYGLQIETDVEWPEIGGEISANTSEVTDAYVYRVSDGALMGQTDISSLSAGDTFTINLDTNLVSGETYNFVLDAGGSSFTLGRYDSKVNYPYTSADGDLSAVDTALHETSTSIAGPAAVRRVGDVGFN